MAFIVADRVKETTTTTGTSDLSLGGPTLQYQSFVSGIGTTNTCDYCLLDANGTGWEVGTGTVTAGSPDTLSRTSVYASTNSGSKISLSAGTHTVFCTAAANHLTHSLDLDNALGATQGNIAFRSATGWTVLAPGTSGNVLTTGGAGANPSWTAVSGGGGGGGTPPTVVQAGGVVGTSAAVTLSGTPAAGNVLLAVGTHWSNGVGVSAGWTAIIVTNGSATDGILAAFRVAGTGESTTQTPFGTSAGGQSTLIWELAGVAGPIAIVGSFQESASVTPTLNSYNSPAGLIVGAFSVQASNYDYPLTGATGIDANVTSTTPNNTPRRIKGFHVNGATGHATVIATLNAAHDTAGFMFYIPGSGSGAGNTDVVLQRGGLYGSLTAVIPTQANTGFTSWLNQGTATAVDTPAGISINSPSAGGDNIIGLLRAAPATPYHLRFLIAMSGFFTNFRIAGIGWQDPVSGKILGLEVGNIGVRYMRYNNPNSSGGPITTDGLINNPTWLHLLNDGTNYSIGLSYDGEHPYFYDTNVFSASFLGSGAAFANIIFYTNMIGGAATGTMLAAPDLVASTADVPVTLDNLTDVTAPTPTVGQSLVWNGTAWVNSNVSSAAGYTTWSTTDRDTGLALSSGYLTVSGQSQTVASGVRGNRSATTGKLYFEMLPNAGGTASAFGLADASAARNDGGGTVHCVAVQVTNGNIWFNNAHTISLGAVVGKVVGCAVDATNPASVKVWFKNITDGGNWNGTGGADPATGTGGFTLTGISVPLYPYAVIQGSSADNVTANFGTGAFLGAIPSSFAPYGAFNVPSGLYSQVLSTTPTQANTGLLSWLNQPAGSTVTNNAVGLTVFKPAQANPDLALVSMTPPATPYSYTALVTATTPIIPPTGSGHYGGLTFGFSDGTKTIGHQFNYSTVSSTPGWGLSITTYSALNNYGSSSPTGFMFPMHAPMWVRIRDDGTNINFLWSTDGVNFVSYYSQARTSYISAVSYIVFGAFDYTVTIDVYATLLSLTRGN